MRIVNVHEAKTSLSKLLAEVEAGNEVIIARANKPVARLAPLSAISKPVRGYGSFTHLQNQIPDSFFFDPLSEDELRDWEGGD